MSNKIASMNFDRSAHDVLSKGMNYNNFDELYASGAKPAYFGLGFIQIKISDDTRVHVWHPAITQTVGPEEIHNHRYGFTSTVLRGRITNAIYEVEHTDDASSRFVIQNVDCKGGETTLPFYGKYRLIAQHNVDAGSSYTMWPDTFHRISARRAVTLLQRSMADHRHYAQVVRAASDPHVCPFNDPNEYSEERLWEFVRDAYADTSSIEEEPALPVVSPGYHLAAIARGEVGEPSKLLEEVQEIIDARNQNCSVMELVEMSDLYGAMEALLEKHHPGRTMDDLAVMAGITRRAFKNGAR